MEERKITTGEKVKRSKIYILLRRNIVPLSVISLIIFLQLVGFWDIRRYEIVEREEKEIAGRITEQFERYIEEGILGSNFFIFAPEKACEEMSKDFPYLESVRIEKVFPNKVVLNVKLHEAGYVAQLKGGSCYITSDQGYILEEICVEQEEGCCVESATADLPLISSPESEPSNIYRGVRKFLLVQDIEKLRKVVENYGYLVVGITIEDEVIELKDTDGRVSRFNISTDLETQMSRYVVVVGKALSDGIEYSTVDLRFERPVMKL